MPAPGGYGITPGLYRVPDLLTEEQFVRYMEDVYGVKVAFTYTDNKGKEVDAPHAAAARALGQSFNIAPVAQLDDRANAKDFDVDNAQSLFSGVDPVLREINSVNSPDAYDTTPVAERKDEEPVDTNAGPEGEKKTGQPVDEKKTSQPESPKTTTDPVVAEKGSTSVGKGTPSSSTTTKK